MKLILRSLFFLGLFLFVVLVWKSFSVLSSDAVGMAIGVLFGVLAGVPSALLVLASDRKRSDWPASVLPTSPVQPEPTIYRVVVVDQQAPRIRYVDSGMVKHE